MCRNHTQTLVFILIPIVEPVSAAGARQRSNQGARTQPAFLLLQEVGPAAGTRRTGSGGPSWLLHLLKLLALMHTCCWKASSSAWIAERQRRRPAAEGMPACLPAPSVEPPPPPPLPPSLPPGKGKKAKAGGGGASSWGSGGREAPCLALPFVAAPAGGEQRRIPS